MAPIFEADTKIVECRVTAMRGGGQFGVPGFFGVFRKISLVFADVLMFLTFPQAHRHSFTLFYDDGKCTRVTGIAVRDID
jgi:hypothetical protein